MLYIGVKEVFGVAVNLSACSSDLHEIRFFGFGSAPQRDWQRAALWLHQACESLGRRWQNRIGDAFIRASACSCRQVRAETSSAETLGATQEEMLIKIIGRLCEEITEQTCGNPKWATTWNCPARSERFVWLDHSICCGRSSGMCHLGS